MLLLLRQIRRKLMTENKFTTYLLYAIGEIVLVVIGILIAISLDSWNAEQTRSNENEKLLINLIRDLKRDSARFYFIAEGKDPNVTSLRTGIDNCKKLKKISYMQLNAQWVDSLQTINGNAGFEVLNAETNVYDQLKSTGRLYSIGSDTLRLKIIEYYSRVSSDAFYIDRYNDLSIGGMMSLQFFRNLRMDRENDPDFDLNNYPWLFDTRSQEMQKYRDAINRLGNFQLRSYNKFMGLRDQASKLIKHIEEELPESALTSE